MAGAAEMTNHPLPSQIRLSFRIRSYLILNLYVAIVLAGVVFVAGFPRQYRTQVGIGVAMVIPILLGFLSQATMRPGARREFALVLLVWAGFGQFLMWLSLPFLVLRCPFLFPPDWRYYSETFVSDCLIKDNDKIFYVYSRLVVLSIYFVLFPLSGWISILAAIRWAFPRACPACGRRRLIPAERVRSGPRSDDSYFWCLACDSRWKRHSRHPAGWEDASAPEDDRFYNLRSPVIDFSKLLLWWRSRR